MQFNIFVNIMHINVNASYRYECRHFFDNDVKENFEQKLSVDEIYNIFRVETKLIALFC